MQLLLINAFKKLNIGTPEYFNKNANIEFTTDNPKEKSEDSVTTSSYNSDAEPSSNNNTSSSSIETEECFILRIAFPMWNQFC